MNLKMQMYLAYSLFVIFVYISGSQPGVRVPPGVRERTLGVHQILLTLKLIFNITIFCQ